MRILLVDDEELHRRAMRVTLQRERPELDIVGEASDGLEALDLADTHNPDVIMMDIKMPEKNGIETVEALRERGDLTRIIFLTAYDEFEYARRAIDLHADAYLLKPVEKSDLLRVLDDCQERIRVEDVHRASRDTGSEFARIRRWAQQEFVRALIEGESARFAEVAAGLDLSFERGVLAVVRLPVSCDGCAGAVARSLGAKKTMYRAGIGDEPTVFVVIDGDQATVRRLIDSQLQTLGGGGRDVAVGLVDGVGKRSRETYRELRAKLGLPTNESETSVDIDISATESAHNDLPSGRSWRMERALSFVDSHLDRELFLDDVAGHAGITAQHLSRLFRDEIGESFTRYVSERRIDRARFLLLTSPLNIGEIADRVGFRDANYFGKVFRRFTGISASEYRSSRTD